MKNWLSGVHSASLMQGAILHKYLIHTMGFYDLTKAERVKKVEHIQQKLLVSFKHEHI